MEKKTQAEIDLKAADIWAAMDRNERHGVRFGLFPALKMNEAEREGFNGRLLCIALMNCAEKDGGMRA